MDRNRSRIRLRPRRDGPARSPRICPVEGVVNGRPRRTAQRHRGAGGNGPTPATRNRPRQEICVHETQAIAQPALQEINLTLIRPREGVCVTIGRNGPVARPRVRPARYLARLRLLQLPRQLVHHSIHLPIREQPLTQVLVAIDIPLPEVNLLK